MGLVFSALHCFSDLWGGGGGDSNESDVFIVGYTLELVVHT